MPITITAASGHSDKGFAVLSFDDSEVPFGTLVNINTGDDAEALRQWHAPDRWNRIAVAVRQWYESLEGVDFASFTMWHTGHSINPIDVELMVVPGDVTDEMVQRLIEIIQEHYADVVTEP